MKKVDAKIRHITKSDANVFAELGFPPNEAKRYLAESRAQIQHTRCAQDSVTGEVDAICHGIVIPDKF
ncbi:hypothetical protein H8L32_06280 [Undibacterium sp. CY18W]|uniref:Uncharacterized protein n=1 Tax=Undibacterium hunanense TaxID=2762292 RepID=A0ABR6ZMG9_9BURK|nr:hypothetical protein [Undibacterium hunanense]MBC3917076.1 hypothetical protein [Undibacterium hunanense]